MDMPCHACRGVAVADAIRKNHACKVVAAGEHRKKIAASVAAGRHSNDIAFQSRQIQRAVRFLVPSPQLHAAERTHRRSGAIKLLGFNLLELHIILMPEELAWVQYLPQPRRPPVLRESSRRTVGSSHAQPASISLFPLTCRMMLACASCLSKTTRALRDLWPRACASKRMPSMFRVTVTTRFINRLSTPTTW